MQMKAQLNFLWVGMAFASGQGKTGFLEIHLDAAVDHAVSGSHDKNKSVIAKTISKHDTGLHSDKQKHKDQDQGSILVGASKNLLETASAYLAAKDPKTGDTNDPDQNVAVTDLATDTITEGETVASTGGGLPGKDANPSVCWYAECKALAAGLDDCNTLAARVSPPTTFTQYNSNTGRGNCHLDTAMTKESVDKSPDSKPTTVFVKGTSGAVEEYPAGACWFLVKGGKPDYKGSDANNPSKTICDPGKYPVINLGEGRGCKYVDTEAFAEAISISEPGLTKCNGVDSFETFLQYMKGEDAVWDVEEKDVFIALLVIAAGDHKLEDAELETLLTACKWADKDSSMELDAVERTALLTKVQENVGLNAADDKREVDTSTVNSVGCAEAFQVMGPMPFVYAVQIDRKNACDELITVTKYVAGGDETFQEDEKVDLVAMLVAASGDLKLGEGEMKLLAGAMDQFDTSPKDGSLDANERQAMAERAKEKFATGM